MLGRVLIIGGGIGGLSAGIALRRIGVAAEIFEAAPELREVGAGVGLWSNALASLDQLGVALRSAAWPLRVLAGANDAGDEISHIDLDELGAEFADAACFIVPRPMLLAALASALPADSIHTGRRATRIEIVGERVRVHFAAGDYTEGELVIGADGLHSVVRPVVLGRSDTIRYSGQTCFRGIAQLGPVDARALREIHGRGQRGAVCAINANSVYWWTAHNAPQGTIIESERRQAYLLDKYRGWPFGLPDAIAGTASVRILQNDLVDRPPALRYANGRLVLIGDAAHPTTPNLGQGANMAIDDGIALARALRQAPDLPRALARYETERLPRTRKIVNRSWQFGRLCLWQSRTAVALREFLARTTPTSMMKRLLREQIIESVGELLSC